MQVVLREIVQMSFRPQPAAQDAARVGTRTEGTHRDLSEIVKSAFQAALSKVIERPEDMDPGSYIAGEGLGPDMATAIGKILNLVGDPLQSANPAGPTGAAFKLFGAKPIRTLTEAAEDIPRLAGGRSPMGRLEGFLFDPKAPGRGIHHLFSSVAERPRAEGLEMIVERIPRLKLPAESNRSLGMLTALFKKNPQLGEALVSSMPRGTTFEEMEAVLRGAPALKGRRLERNLVEIVEAARAEFPGITSGRLSTGFGQRMSKQVSPRSSKTRRLVGPEAEAAAKKAKPPGAQEKEVRKAVEEMVKRTKKRG